ncbi:DUF4426 domain-containing protein [Mangrovimicrobium sediminis]|uniref:DUF4426 domain-containing protein n=1 Tax=Mangrovimicrobium sediminis TaxID=2562682 RepID=A0A4Z0LZX8_9GAMM|nr:DUF4426 domain-containing protein [Haliea sp. SAOS-164]TGD72727.1 DUF4426 domain-containing protein [Haliea sp. SAOS-164]
MRYLLCSLIVAVTALAVPASAQQSKRFGPYELHYAVVNTTFLDPQVAAAYGIVRGDDRAILNLALREHLPDGSDVARAMQLKGSSWDLLQKSTELEFQEVSEPPAIYYIAPFDFLNEEWRHFEIHFRAENSDETQTFKFKQQVYEELKK